MSRLRHQRPGPRPVRGRGERRFQLPNLTDREKALVMGDSALVFKMLGLYEMMVQSQEVKGRTAFALEHPMDVEDYMNETGPEEYPSIWEWEEVRKFAKGFNMDFIGFEQGAMGHQRKKPTMLMSDLRDLRQLEGMKASGQVQEEMEKDLQRRMAQTGTWAEWAPGLVAAMMRAVKDFVVGSVDLRKFSLEDWKQHVRQNHIPYRKDCRLCLEEMGQDLPHRRRKYEKGESAYVLSVDVAGPFTTGWDFGRSREARYALLATIPIPVSKELEEGEKKELTTDSVEMTEFDEFQESEAELKAISTIERFNNEESEKQAKLAGEPINVQNVTLMEPLASRQAGDVVRALDKLWAQFRAMGIPAFRLHSDRAKELLSSQVEAWATKNHLHQTMTSGDDPQSNGRIESEVCQWKRRLRLTLKSAQVGAEEWPSVGRHVSEERLRRQLARVGMKSLPMLRYNQRVWVKTKVWHKRYTQGIASPYFEARLKGPSPVMSHGCVVQGDDGKTQHARAVLTIDPDSERAIMELVEDGDEKPLRRIHGKQVPEGGRKVPPPRLLEDPRIRARVDDLEDHPLPPLDAELSSLQHPLPRSTQCRVSSDLAEPGQAYTHIGRNDEERQKKEDHQAGNTLSWGEFDTSMSSRWAGGEQVSKVLEKKEHENNFHSSTSQSAPMRKCGGCGLLQPFRVKKCGYCEEENRGGDVEGSEQGEWKWELDMTKDEYEKIIDGQQLGWSATYRDWIEKGPESSGGCDEYVDMIEEMEYRIAKLDDDVRRSRSGDEESRNGECEQAARGEVGASGVLQTRTVALSEVRRNLPLWREAMKAEYKSLVETTKAVVPIRKEDLKDRRDVEYAPGKLVATIKAPDGKYKARVVVCGNRVESSVDGQEDGAEESMFASKEKTFDHYAAGIDGPTIRATLRHAGQRNWQGAVTDVKTAFLLAPRRASSGLLVVKPPKVLVEAQVIPPEELWSVSKALYGLQSSPADWSHYRDKELSSWRWKRGGLSYSLRQSSESNLWAICVDAGQSKKVVGRLVVYVDDLLVLGEDETVTSVLEEVQRHWTCSSPEYLGAESKVKFCGFELRKTEKGIHVGQGSYAEELVARHGCDQTRPVPMSAALASRMADFPEEDPGEADRGEVRRAQAITGELLWLSVRTRPDLAYTVGVMGRYATRQPGFVLEVGREAIAYLKSCSNLELVYGPCEDGEEGGPTGVLSFPRSMRRLEIFADVSFAPQSSRSIQGIMACYGGAIVQWESSRQTICSMSTAEAELCSYVESLRLFLVY